MSRSFSTAFLAAVSTVAIALPVAAEEPPATDAPAATSDKAESPAAGTKSPSGRANRRRSRPEDKQPALITADQIVHDRDLNTVTASGHVEVDQGGRILLANGLSYNLKQDVIVATGNVSLTEATGEVTFSDYIELTGDMKTAAAEGIRVLMIDDSRIAANKGHRVAGDRSVFDKAVYTACKPCEDDSDTPPLWQIKANRVIHDETSHLIEYNDAWLEMGGVPMAYTPYMSHADPSVKRESGLLPPSVINNKIVGEGVRVPYFVVIDPYQDITLTPMVSNNDYEQLGMTHRWRDFYGGTKTTFSATNMPQSSVESNATIGWHIDAYSQFDFDDTWRAGYQIQRASDLYYLSTFGYHTPQPYLTTHPYLEGFWYRDYAAVEAYAFQSLTTTTTTTSTNPMTAKSPVVFPLATYSHVSEPGNAGNYWSFDTHAAVITREDGGDSRQVNTLTAWHLPYTAADGELYKLTTSVRADGYNADNLATDYTKQVSTGRAIPEVSLDWRYPFTRLGDHSSQTISPIVMTSLSPYGGNSWKIPNEDSVDFELDDTNIFKSDPGSGYDRVLTGPRVAYGGQYTISNRGLGTADLMLAQSYQLHNEAVFTQGSGLDHHLSDIVGRANIAPSSNLSAQYDFRLDRNDLTARRNEVSTSIGPRALNLQTSYVFYDRLSPTSLFNSREQIGGTLTAQATHYWSTQLYTTRDINSGGEPLETGVRLTYEDECFLVTADAGSRHTTVKTFSAGHYFTLRINFKTLTQIPVDVF